MNSQEIPFILFILFAAFPQHIPQGNFNHLKSQDQNNLFAAKTAPAK
jgi:hypothetical protein